MASAKKLQERVPIGRTAWRLADVVVLFLLLALLALRAAELLRHGGGRSPWLAALVCEAWFTFVWTLTMNAKWNPVRFETYPENLQERIDELPAVDMFVTTADPALEPPLITVNTVLSLLAVDYPGGKLACYVSDDGCSPVTCYAMREAARFARLWVPFCKRYNVAVRAPFRYFSSRPAFGPADSKFSDDWTFIKGEYEKLARRIEDADEGSLLRHGGGEFADFLDAERRNHPTIIKVDHYSLTPCHTHTHSLKRAANFSDNSLSFCWVQVLYDNSKDRIGEGFPHVIYVSREKSPKHHHHYKAGAMNVLARVSAVMTNAPIMLNVDCDMFANNPQVVLHAMCLLLGFDDEIHSGFVQAPQNFYGGLKDDPFGNQMEVLFKKIAVGVAGLQGMFYGGTGCFHRRKVIYGVPPDSGRAAEHGSPSYKDLQKKFGSSKELIESARNTVSGNLISDPTVDMSSQIEVAKQVAACNYETDTCWGQEVGWVYGSVTEDILTGQQIHAAGWGSTLMVPDPPAFMGCAPTGGPAILTQFKRWATGLLEILISRRNSPILHTIFKRLQFRQCLGYLVVYVWPVRSTFELCYALLGPYCILTNQSFLPKASEDGFVIPLALFLVYGTHGLIEYMDCGLSVRAWWNNHRMQRIASASAWLLAFLTVLLKTVGLSDTVFEVTRKDSKSDGDGSSSSSSGDDDLARFTFDSSPVFVPATALAVLNVVAIAVGAWRAAVVGTAEGGPGIGELVCCGWLVMCFWPFLRGLVGKGSHGVPWSVMLKASLLVAAFLHFCRRN